MHLLVLLLLVLDATGVDQRRTGPSLPPGAIVLESRHLAADGVADRELILWMLRPERRPTGYDDEDPYTCPDETRGSHYSGPARISLFDTKERRIVQTLALLGTDDTDTLDLPYAMRSGYYYPVADAPRSAEGKPTIMQLKDYNGDGSALEFALYDALACMGLRTSLIGYLPDQDRLLQYPIQIQIVTKDGTSYETWHWLAYLFEKKPVAAGSWRFEVDYRGRGGVLERTEIQYNRALKVFEGTLTQVE